MSEFKLPVDWDDLLLTDSFKKDILPVITKESNLAPKLKDIFNFACIPVNEIKVIILGQDPYYKAGQACGLAFSCLTEIPASLLNIYKCLLHNKQITNMPQNGDLSSWAKQGVLLLNTALTTMVGKALVHADLWAKYTDDLLQNLAKKITSHCVVMLWGKHAQKKLNIFTRPNFTVLNYAHPSPLAQSNRAFVDCNHFQVCNKILSLYSIAPIKWDSINDKTNNSESDNKINDKESNKPNNTKIVNDLIRYSKDVIDKCNTTMGGVATEEVALDDLIIGSSDTKSNDDNDNGKNDSNGKNSDKNNIRTVVAFTDGSCYPNNSSKDARGGFAVSFALNSLQDINIIGNIPITHHPATNQRAEGFAILHTLQFLKKHINCWDRCVIITDSKFWIQMFEIYMPNWSKETFAQKKNSDMTNIMYDLYLALIATKTIEFRHIASHGKSGWDKKPKRSYEYFCYVQNKYVDELASYARLGVPLGETELDVANY